MLTYLHETVHVANHCILLLMIEKAQAGVCLVLTFIIVHQYFTRAQAKPQSIKASLHGGDDDFAGADGLLWPRSACQSVGDVNGTAFVMGITIPGIQ